MQDSVIALISIAIARAVAIVFGGIALCAGILGGAGFALVSLYTLLVPNLGPAAAAFATSSVALAIPVAIMTGVAVAARFWVLGELPGEPAVAYTPKRAERRMPPANAGAERAIGWIAERPRAASLGTLSLGAALGAYPDLRKRVLDGVDTSLARTRVPAS